MLLSGTLLPSMPGYGQTTAPASDTRSVQLDSLTVSAQRIPTRLDRAGRSVSIIERAELEQLPVNSLQEALSYAAGVEIRQRGPFGAQGDTRVRGGSFNQVLVLLNGIRMNDPQTGHHQLNLPIALIDVERIEIIRGPAARAYGPNAFSGAINIVTRAPADSLRVEAELSAGSHQAFRHGIGIAWQTGETRHRLATQGIAHDGYRPGTEYEQNNFMYQGRAGRQNLRWLAGYNQRDFGANRFYSTSFPNQNEETEAVFGALQWRGRGNWSPQGQGYVRRHQDRFAIEIVGDTLVNRHTTWAYGLEGQVQRSWTAGITSVGLDLRREAIASTNLDTLHNYQLNSYLEHQLWLNERVKLVGGALVHWHSEFGASLHPGLDAVWLAGRRWRLYASVNRSLRHPTYTERNYQSPANLGNPSLESEEALAFELGGRYLKGNLHGQAAVFYRRADDIIDWHRREDEETFGAVNLATLNTLGFEKAITLEAPSEARWWRRLRINFTALEVERQLRSENVESQYALSHLDYQANASLVAGYRSLELSPSLQWRAPHQRSDYTLAAARLTYRWRELVGSVIVENLADRQYEAYPEVPMPGRWWWVRLETGF
jgi:iron complex outermembrane receptor protein